MMIHYVPLGIQFIEILRIIITKKRLKNLLMSGRKAAVNGEPMEDAYLDVSNYGIMAIVVKNDKWGK